MVTLNKKQSNKFAAAMLKKEKEPISAKDKKLAEDVKKTMERLEIERKYNPTIKKVDDGLCARCHKNKATITYAESILDWNHGFSELICIDCYNKIKHNNTWYKEGRKEAFDGYEEFLKKWFHKWMRKPVSGRCLIELKQWIKDNEKDKFN